MTPQSDHHSGSQAAPVAVAQKLLICDDHPPIRTAVTYVAREINRDIVIFEAGDADEALAHIAGHPDLDLILLDLHMPDRGGLELLADIKSRTPAIPVVVLSSDESRAAVVSALDGGATGYICKSAPTESLSAFLRAALQGKLPLPAAVIRGEGGGSRFESGASGARTPPEAAVRLSPRQREVLGCLLRGMSAKHICRELGLSEGTVKSHTIAVFRALNVSTRAQVVIEASRRGLSIGGDTG